jgi:tetratricopeptide (TPR) repeat protein
MIGFIRIFVLVLLVLTGASPVFCEDAPAPASVPQTKDADRSRSIDPYHPPVETAVFLEISPGTTTAEQLTHYWKDPLRETSVGDSTVRLYSKEPLNHIEVTLKENIVRSIVVQLDIPFPEGQVRAVLQSELLKSKPVLIPDESGEIIGEVFPEKGVILLFAGKDENGGYLVRQLGIEPVSADPFILRAEAVLPDQPTEAKRDIRDAIRLKPDNARGYWLMAQINLKEGNIESALLNCEKAIRLDEQKPGYHLTFAEAMIQMNRIEEAKQYLQATVGICERYPHEKARALTMLGEVYRTSRNPDYELAYECHADAIKLAGALLEHTSPAIRLAAKDVLFEAHLATAKVIAWGKWDKKEEAITKWIERAKFLAKDPEIAAAKRYSREYPFKIASCALATLVAVPEKLNIDLYIEDILDAGNQLIKNVKDPILESKYHWDTSIALYDAVQIFQFRKQYSSALKNGELAAKYMEIGIKNRSSDMDMYLLGRLYFRLGSIHAIVNQNHRAAIMWFDLAKPIFEKLLPKMDTDALGKMGVTLVSMGVSYWVTDQREESILLTERGLRQIERAVQGNTMSKEALAIPYANLSKMYHELGDKEHAAKYTKLAAGVNAGKVR